MYKDFTYLRYTTNQVKAPSLILYLHAPQNVLLNRLLNRGETSGRADDNAETIKKRFNTFKRESLPVISFYEKSSISVVKKVNWIALTVAFSCRKKLRINGQSGLNSDLTTLLCYQICTITPPDDVYKHIQTAVKGVV
jgi:adenylate kinase family enzyme